MQAEHGHDMLEEAVAAAVAFLGDFPFPFFFLEEEEVETGAGEEAAKAAAAAVEDEEDLVFEFSFFLEAAEMMEEEEEEEDAAAAAVEDEDDLSFAFFFLGAGEEAAAAAAAKDPEERLEETGVLHSGFGSDLVFSKIAFKTTRSTTRTKSIPCSCVDDPVLSERVLRARSCESHAGGQG